MADLRFRTFRLKVYTKLCPKDLPPDERQEFLRLLERLDEDGMEAFFSRRQLSNAAERAVRVLKEARELGDRINVLDRMLPALPHAEITECYARLRALGDEVGNLDAAGLLGNVPS
jgi:succinate dehydrogenase flavin-adding protein (antitoxin of CptAB toxin-antitoxin module)